MKLYFIDPNQIMLTLQRRTADGEENIFYLEYWYSHDIPDPSLKVLTISNPNIRQDYYDLVEDILGRAWMVDKLAGIVFMKVIEGK